MNTVLVVDDESDVLDLVRFNLQKAGFETMTASTGLVGLDLARSHRPDLIVLDVMLPGKSGFDICRLLKADKETSHIPVVMLTARGQQDDRINGLEIGADDYVTKPFSPRELILRVKALLRRSKGKPNTNVVEIDGLRLDKTTFEFRLNGEKLELTSTEFKLLAALLDRRGKIQSRDTLLFDVWGYRNAIDTRTVDTHMRRLRDKLGSYASRIETVRGEGYRFIATAGAPDNSA